jgi:hypothetical protein
VAYSYDEGVTTGARLGEDLDLLAVHESKLEESTLERRQGRRAGANAHHASPRARWEGGEAHKAWRAAQAFRGGDSVHISSMDENGSHLQ